MKAETLLSVALALGLGWTSIAQAEEPAAKSTSDTPYIDELRKNLPPQEAPAGTTGSDQPYIDSLRKTIPAGEVPETGGQPYLEQLKRQNPEKFQTPTEGTPYTEEQRAKLPAKESGGAIQAVQEGRSELKPRYVGEIQHAFGIRYGASVSRDVTAGADTMLRPFQDVYGDNYAPDLTFFYEYQFFHHEGAGSLGLVASAGISYFHGTGTFKSDLPKPWNTSLTFGRESQTLFQFFAIPVTVAADYRFNLLKYLCPYVTVGPTVTAYFETRNDGPSGNRGYSKGLYTAAGVAILMDWISSQDAWDSYKSYGIRHSYLTIEFSRLTSIASDVNFSNSGILAGVTFEY